LIIQRGFFVSGVDKGGAFSMSMGSLFSRKRMDFSINPVDTLFGNWYGCVPITDDEANIMGSGRTNTVENYGSFRRACPPETLRQIYLDKTDADIALIYGVSDIAVSKYRRFCQIPTRTSAQRRDAARQIQGLPVIGDLTPVELSSIYIQMGDRAIGLLYGTSKTTIKRLREKWGILPISKSERATQESPLTLAQQEILVGVVLGDGFISRRGSLKVSHSHAQIGYLRHLHEVLGSLSKPIRFDEKVMDSGTVAYEFTLRTQQHVWLKQFRGVFYPDDIKVFPESLLSKLVPRSLAYWYFDDGNLDSGLPSIALGNIPKAMAVDVAGWVGARFGLDTYAILYPSSPNCWLLKFRARTTDIFFSLIQPYLLPELIHKVPKKYRPLGVTPVRPRLTRPSSPFPKDLYMRSKGWCDLDLEGQERLVGDLMVFWRTAGFPLPPVRAEDLDVLAGLSFDHVIRKGKVRQIHSGQGLCYQHMPHFWNTSPMGEKTSPRDLFESGEHLPKVLRMLLGMGSVPNSSRLLGGLRLYRYSGVYNFRPALAKVLVDRFCQDGGRVFDPCGGWGGRLLGTLLSSRQPSYEACEPQPDTYKGLQALHQWLSGYFPGMKSRGVLHPDLAEDMSFPSGVDMVMTSPPYWCKEVYGHQPYLAGNRYKTYAAWLRGFWEPVIQKAVEALRPGGWLVLNVDDFRVRKVLYPLIEDTKAIVGALGLGEPSEIYDYGMPRPTDQGNHEVVLCWSKGALYSPVGSDTIVSTDKCQTCGRVVLSGEGDCSICESRKVKASPCQECGILFKARRKGTQFCSEACGARSRRKRKREANPVVKERTFICRECHEKWTSEQKGNPRTCPDCRERFEIEGRTKTCAYRECNCTFVDTTPRSSMSYCHPEHRRREKMFRTGKVSSVLQFRRPDPVLYQI